MKTYTDSRGTEHPIIASETPTGDPIDGGWALIDLHGEGSYNLVAWEPAAGEGDEDYGKLFILYDVGTPDDADWADLEDVGNSMDIDPEELRDMLTSKDVKKQAWANAEVARYYGWHELTGGNSETKDIFQMIEEFGDDFDEPELDINYEELGSESGLRITGPDYQGYFTVVEWGWVGPQGDEDDEEEIQRIEYSIPMDDLFKGRHGEREALLLAGEDEREELIEAAVRRVLRNSYATQDDVSMVMEIGDD